MLDDIDLKYRAKLQKIIDEEALTDETLNSVAERMAAILGEQLDPPRNWTRNYIKMLLRGKQKCSRFIRTAIDRYSKKQRKAPKLTGQLVYCGQMTDEEKELINKALTTKERTAALVMAAQQKEHEDANKR